MLNRLFALAAIEAIPLKSDTKRLPWLPSTLPYAKDSAAAASFATD